MSSATTRNTSQNSLRSPTPPTHPLQSPLDTPHDSQSKLSHHEMTSAPEKLPLKGSNPRRGAVKAVHSNTRRRQRRDRDASQHLLTPPLTPSSSIRTNASTDSTEGKTDDKALVLKEQMEPESTRFLHLENVSRTISSTVLQNAITDALGHLSFHRGSEGATPTRKGSKTIRDTSCIKGFYLRELRASGSLYLAFYDVRDAIAARLVLSQKTDGALGNCLGEDKLIDGEQDWFRCRFITAEELVKTIGNSNFLATIDGGFVLSATFVNHPNVDGPKEGKSDGTKQAVNMNLLIKLLESYGMLRLLRPESERKDGQNWSVEYFDIRDAGEAYVALNDQTIFGMTLHTSNGAPPEPSQQAGTPDPLCDKVERSDTPLSHHQPSASESHLPRLRPSIAPSGEAPCTRGRFVSEITRSRPRAMSVGNEATSPVSPPKTSSPTIFYTSFDYESQPATSRASSEKAARGQPPDRSDNSLSDSGQQPKPWELQQACSIADCRYCPSRGNDRPSLQQPFVNQLQPPYSNPLSFPMQSSPHVFITPQEFDVPAPFPVPGWPFDPALIAPSVNGSLDLFSPPFIPTIPAVPIDHRLPNPSPNTNFIPNGVVFPSLSPTNFLETSPPVAIDPHHIFVPNTSEPVLSASVNADVDLTLAASCPGVSDRNFLNISRIEEGLDTRTTVMIKNIPNKMTAKDLIQYINEVSPRKIDFLYLRMDFKNGCNVGYAFVNFIHVQDMLKFAKRRLGVKWNLFSSEKVLQMSYANYQGKEALVEKFKNSCIMDEREEWRPKIFYSNGPEQGLPEPFPAPTHLRRKERSSYNRGALYVPGAPGTSATGNGYLNNGPTRRQEFLSAPSSKYLEHRTRSVDRCTEGVACGGRRGRAQVERSR